MNYVLFVRTVNKLYQKHKTWDLGPLYVPLQNQVRTLFYSNICIIYFLFVVLFFYCPPLNYQHLIYGSKTPKVYQYRLD